MWAALPMVRELLRYRSADDLYEDWLDHIAELVSAAGGSPAPSLSLPRPPPATGDVAHGASPPPLHQDGALAPRRAAPRRDPPCRAPAREEGSAKKFPGRKRMLPRSQRHRDKTACLLQWRRADIRGRLRISKGPRWPQQGAAPSLWSCVASSDLASSSRTCLLAMTAPPILRSSCSSTS